MNGKIKDAIVNLLVDVKKSNLHTLGNFTNLYARATIKQRWF